jgi:hypothetical protein
MFIHPETKLANSAGVSINPATPKAATTRFKIAKKETQLTMAPKTTHFSRKKLVIILCSTRRFEYNNLASELFHRPPLRCVRLLIHSSGSFIHWGKFQDRVKTQAGEYGLQLPTVWIARGVYSAIYKQTSK